MLHRRRPVVSAKIINRLIRQIPVLNVKRARLNLAEELIPKVERNNQIGRNRAKQQHQQRRRQNPPRPPRPKTSQRNTPTALNLTHQMTGNQKPGNRKENINTDIAAGNQPRPIMKNNNRRDRNRTQSLNLRPQHAPLHTSGAPRAHRIIGHRLSFSAPRSALHAELRAASVPALGAPPRHNGQPRRPYCDRSSDRC